MDLKKSTTEGESSKLTEETCAVATASLTKRKAESETVEESGDDESEEYESEEDENGEDKYVDPDEEITNPNIWWTRPEWDVDSFDGKEYQSSDNEFSEEEADKWRRYKRQTIASKGFYVEPGLSYVIKAVRNLESPAGYGQTHHEYFADMACLCLQKYNEEKGLNVEFVEVVRGNFTIGSRSKSYITFMAREKPDGPLIEYQAKTWCTFKQGENYPILCRPAPTPNPWNQN